MTTKAYTIARLIREVSAVKPSRAATAQALALAISPREGVASVKVAVLDSFLDGALTEVVNGYGDFAILGATARGRVLRALRNRKRTGDIFAGYFSTY